MDAMGTGGAMGHRQHLSCPQHDCHHRMAAWLPARPPARLPACGALPIRLPACGRLSPLSCPVSHTLCLPPHAPTCSRPLPGAVHTGGPPTPRLGGPLACLPVQRAPAVHPPVRCGQCGCSPVLRCAPACLPACLPACDCIAFRVLLRRRRPLSSAPNLSCPANRITYVLLPFYFMPARRLRRPR
jgi:hypothetical protein